MLLYGCERLFATKLECNFTPRGFSQRSTIFPASTCKRIEFRADKDRYSRRWYRLHASTFQNAGNAFPRQRLRATFRQVVEKCECVGLAAAELRREVEHRRR